ncbi:MAG: tetratricopeptide repeat protein [Deltaproteobacteria bacterium]
MEQTRVDKLLADGLKELDRGNTRGALGKLEEAARMERRPKILSNLAYCRAKENRDFDAAISLCREAISDESTSSLHYLNLGRVYLLCGKKKEAIRTFLDGQRHENNSQIREELIGIGWRKPPVIHSLPREHLLNRVIGLLLSRLKIR